MRRMAFGSSRSAVATIHCPAKPNTERPAIGWTSIGRDDGSRPLSTGSSGSTRPNMMTSQENIDVVLILQGRRGLLLELQQARERAPRPHEVFGAVQATSDRLDILINNASISTASPRQTSAEEFETEPWPVGIFRRLLSSKFRFARDSLLEGSGFELPVPEREDRVSRLGLLRYLPSFS